MITQEIIKAALRRVANASIYSRGMTYYHSGRVKQCIVQEDSNHTFTITGKVRGNSMYRVSMEFNSEGEKFEQITCACPYENVCKHAIALGLTFASTFEKAQQDFIDTIAAKKVLAELGLSVDELPDNLIESLLSYRHTPKRNIASQQKQQYTPRRFNPQDYYFTLHKYNGYVPVFHEKRYSYQQASINTMLKRTDLAQPQRQLLMYLKKNNFSGHYDSPRPDPQQLFPLLIASGFPVYDSYGYTPDKQVTLDVHPKSIRAEIVYEPFINPLGQKREEFFFRVSKEYWPRKASPWYTSPFTVYSSCLVREVDRENKLELHSLTPLLTPLFSRLEPVFLDYMRKKISVYQTKLTGTEIAQFEQLVKDASSLLELSSPPPLFTSQSAKTAPHPAFVVDYDNAEEKLRILPVLDYGIYQQDISESVYLSRSRDGKILRRRGNYLHSSTHIITVEHQMIHHTPIEEKQEIAFYEELIKKAPELGFTKTLKYQRTGKKQIKEFFSIFWKRLVSYAEQQGYPLILTHDKLPTEQEVFRADFTTDLDVDNNWLFFDVACYCGEEKVTLDKLFAFIETGERFWQKADGTLVEIANREALETLVRLLKSFHARENGGFEGQLHHAPELAYVVTSSEYYNAKQAESFTQFLNRVHSGKPIEKITLPQDLTTTLRPYQAEGIEWLYFLRSYRFGGILADDMGLGKTLQTLSMLSLEKRDGKPSLVVCPKTLLYTWKKETEKFFPHLRVIVYDDTPNERFKKRKKLVKHDIVIVSYGILKQDEKVFAQTKFNYAILDEAQYIKNHATKSAQIVKKIDAEYRLALTGTPLENSVTELWSMFDFLMPGFLGDLKHFLENFQRPIMDKADGRALEHLREKVKPFMLRRTKKEVLKELPQKIEQISQCQLTQAQSILYQQILLKVRGEVFDAVKKKGFQSAQIHILAGLMKLRQVCNHPALLLKNKDFHQYESAKLDLCIELVEEVIESGRKVLIFSQFTSMLDIVSETLKEMQISHIYLSGKTKNRQELVDTFTSDPSIPVFLISLKAGGTGLNLTVADTVIIFDPWWNPSVENQAVDRTHRIGQTSTVNVYRLLTLGTIEEKIQSLKQKKQQLFDAVIGESGDMFKKLTWEDVQGLFAT